MGVEMSDIRKMAIIVAVMMVMVLAVAPAMAQRAHQFVPTRDQVKKIERYLKDQQKELQEYRDLVQDFEDATVQSSNAGRGRAATEIQEMMVQVILDMEEKVSRVHVIQQHGKDPRQTDPLPQGYKSTLARDRSALENEYRTGAPGTKPALSRLARMQSAYRLCSQIKSSAVDKQGNSVERYIYNSNEFAKLWAYELQIVHGLLPDEDDGYSDLSFGQ